MRVLPLLALSALVFATPAAARADDVPAAGPDAVEAARKTLGAWLEAVKTKKWEPAKKVTHPKTLEVIADLKKRTGVENHQLAPWAHLKESYLVKFELGEATASARGAVVVKATEEHFSVEDKGSEEGVLAEYLLVPLAGGWYVTDRRLGENVYPAKALAASFKGYFEGEYELKAPAPTKKKGKGK